jgi:hypothetical protein
MLAYYLRKPHISRAATELLTNAGMKQDDLIFFPEVEDNVSPENQFMPSDDEGRYSYRKTDPFAQRLMETTCYGTRFHVFIPSHLNGEGPYPYHVAGSFPGSILDNISTTDSVTMHQMEPVVDLLFEKLYNLFDEE